MPHLLLLLTALAAPLPMSKQSSLQSNNALVVTDPAVMVALEAGGLDLGTVLGGSGASTNALYDGTPAYKDLVDLLGRDQDLLAARDPKSGVGFGHSHRAFDTGWLRADNGRFELIAVVNRLDRTHVRDTGCGERRLVYRLAYTVDQTASRMPMTLNIIMAQNPWPGEVGCAEVAKRWLAVDGVPDVAAALLKGPLAGKLQVLRVETNLQSVRYPSGIRPDLGGHAGYILRSFRMKAGRLSIGPLENTPTVTLDGKRKKALKKYLRANLEAIDDGTLVLPEKFLAKRSVSASPRGLRRAANRPYHKVFGSAKRIFNGVKFDALPRLRTRDGAMRRLESMSCKGCHQSGSLAGFHMLGEARSADQRWNAVAVGASPHLLGEMAWRRDGLEAVAAARPYAVPRPFAERTGGGEVGARCGLSDPTFADWKCDEGLVCHDVIDDAVGICSHPAPVPPGGLTELSKLVPSKNRKPDRVRLKSRLDCANDSDDPERTRGARSSDGFPGGMCHAPCETLGERRGDAVCGGVPFDGGKLFGGFTHCLAVLKRTFEECIADSSKPTWLQFCDASKPCREDYLCARVPGLPVNEGACLPTYFLAQIRVDGHAKSR